MVFAALVMFYPSGTQAKDENKKICKELKKEKKNLEKEKSQVMFDRQAIRGQYEEAKASFDLEKSQLLKMNDCSKGNPNNTPDCNQLLSKIHATGQNLTNYQKLVSEKNNAKWKLDNEIKTNSLNFSNKQCDKKK